MRNTRNQKGFTIMELMIVIIIIGILIAIAVPAYSSFRDRAQQAACQANRRTIKSAWGLYIADGGTDAAMTTAEITSNLSATTGVKYIVVVPDCPVTANSYSIAVGGAVSCSGTTHTPAI